MIPKVIHYCWFGGKELPELARKCIDSWKKYCPDYNIIEWNESNFNLNENTYCREAFDAKKWAFITDYVRLKVLYERGGIYMDTDVEVIRPFSEELLSNHAFSGFENSTQVPTGIMASEAGLRIIGDMLKEYDNRKFIDKDGRPDITTNVVTITNFFEKRGLEMNNTFQVIEGFALYPNDFFCPKDYSSGKICLSKNTYTIHHFGGSWKSASEVRIHKLKQIIKGIIRH